MEGGLSQALGDKMPLGFNWAYPGHKVQGTGITGGMISRFLTSVVVLDIQLGQGMTEGQRENARDRG